MNTAHLSIGHDIDSQLPLLFEGLLNGAVFLSSQLLQLEAAFRVRRASLQQLWRAQRLPTCSARNLIDMVDKLHPLGSNSSTNMFPGEKRRHSIGARRTRQGLRA